MKISQLIKLIEADGWYLIRQRGSHKQYKHPTKKGLITISGHRPSDEISKGALHSVLKQAGLEDLK